MSEVFNDKELELEDYWRAIILRGRNVASYKFALAKTLLDLKPESGQLIKIGELAPLFSSHIAEHLKKANKQGTSASSQFLDTCRRFNAGGMDENTLIDQTIRFGFVNVIDAFHVVNQAPTSIRFFNDERQENKGIRITDQFSALLEKQQILNLPVEVESRWRLVETSWELALPRTVLSINYDQNRDVLFTVDRDQKRINITGCRDALNGYQKGRCFYCFSEIFIDKSNTPPEVDHFFPHVLKQYNFGPIIDGVWNLQLACKDCNRGESGKFARLPVMRLLKRLHRRNEFLISSHHPLREVLMEQTGKTLEQRIEFLNDFYDRAKTILIHQWDVEEKFPQVF
jgi:5-methylcytosine-specific restriction endonuclease McrA